MEQKNGNNGGRELSEVTKIAGKIKTLALSMAKISEDHLKGKQTGTVSRQILLMEAQRLEEAVKKISHDAQLRASQAGMGAKNRAALMTAVTEAKRLEDSVKRLSTEAMILAGPSRLRHIEYRGKGDDRTSKSEQIFGSSIPNSRTTSPSRQAIGKSTQFRNDHQSQVEEFGSKTYNNPQHANSTLIKQLSKRGSQPESPSRRPEYDESSDESEPIIPKYHQQVGSQSRNVSTRFSDPSTYSATANTRANYNKWGGHDDSKSAVDNVAASNKSYRHASIKEQRSFSNRQKIEGRSGVMYSNSIMTGTDTFVENGESHNGTGTPLPTQSQLQSSLSETADESLNGDLDPSPSFRHGEKSVRSILSDGSESRMLKKILSNEDNGIQSVPSTILQDAPPSDSAITQPVSSNIESVKRDEKQSTPSPNNEEQDTQNETATADAASAHGSTQGGGSVSDIRRTTSQGSKYSSISKKSKSLRKKLWKAAAKLNSETEMGTVNEDTTSTKGSPVSTGNDQPADANREAPSDEKESKLLSSKNGEDTNNDNEMIPSNTKEAEGETSFRGNVNLDTAPIFTATSMRSMQSNAHGHGIVSTSIQESISCVSDDPSIHAVSSNLSDSASYSELVKYMSYQDNTERGFEVLLYDSERFRKKYFPAILEEGEDSVCSVPSHEDDSKNDNVDNRDDDMPDNRSQTNSVSNDKKSKLNKKGSFSSVPPAESQITPNSKATTVVQNNSMKSLKLTRSNRSVNSRTGRYVTKGSGGPTDEQSVVSAGSKHSTKTSSSVKSKKRSDTRTTSPLPPVADIDKKQSVLSSPSSLGNDSSNLIMVETVHSEVN